MIDEKLYRETFSRLRASDEAKKEVLMNITEKKTRRPWKALRGAAIAAVLTVALAVSANAASNGELMESIFQTFVVTFTTADGTDETVTVNVSEGAPDTFVQGYVSLDMADAVFTEKRDGRLFLIAGGEETDITDALTKDGQYTVKLEDGSSITVQGTVENHMILSSEEGSNDYYITTSTTGEDAEALDGVQKNLSNADEVTASYAPMEAAEK